MFNQKFLCTKSTAQALWYYNAYLIVKIVCNVLFKKTIYKGKVLVQGSNQMRLSDLKSSTFVNKISTIHINHQIVLISYDIIIYVIYIITYTYTFVSYKEPTCACVSSLPSWTVLIYSWSLFKAIWQIWRTYNKGKIGCHI